ERADCAVVEEIESTAAGRPRRRRAALLVTIERLRRRAVWLPEGLHDLFPHRLERNAERLEDARRDALALAHETEQQMLGTDVVVVETDRLVLSKCEDALRAVVEAIERTAVSLMWRDGRWRSHARSSLRRHCPGAGRERRRRSIRPVAPCAATADREPVRRDHHRGAGDRACDRSCDSADEDRFVHARTLSARPAEPAP